MPGVNDYLEHEDGVLYVDGIRSVDLASRFSTPLYVYRARRIRDNDRQVHDVFTARKDNFRANYAVKANSNLAVLDLLRARARRPTARALGEASLSEGEPKRTHSRCLPLRVVPNAGQANGISAGARWPGAPR